MPKKKVGQFDHYRKWTTDEGYTFLAENKKYAEQYLIVTGIDMNLLSLIVPLKMSGTIINYLRHLLFLI